MYSIANAINYIIDNNMICQCVRYPFRNIHNLIYTHNIYVNIKHQSLQRFEMVVNVVPHPLQALLHVEFIHHNLLQHLLVSFSSVNQLLQSRVDLGLVLWLAHSVVHLRELLQCLLGVHVEECAYFAPL